METNELQNQIKNYLDQLDWSYYNLAEAVYEYENNDFGINEKIEINKLYNKIKKQLVRSTTKPSCLLKYLEVIEDSEKFLSLSKVKLNYIRHEEISDGIEKFLKKISIQLDKSINLAK